MNPEVMDVFNSLRDKGYAVVIFSPEELGSAPPEDVEDRLIELGWDAISMAREE
jgi:hypothetical protein